MQNRLYLRILSIIVIAIEQYIGLIYWRYKYIHYTKELIEKRKMKSKKNNYMRKESLKSKVVKKLETVELI